MFLDDTCDASNRKLFVLAPLWYPFSSSRSTLQHCADLALVMKVLHIDHGSYNSRNSCCRRKIVRGFAGVSMSSRFTEFTVSAVTLPWGPLKSAATRIPYLSCFWGMIHSSFHQIATISEVFDSHDQRLIILPSCGATVWEAALRCNAECVTRVVFKLDEETSKGLYFNKQS